MKRHTADEIAFSLARASELAKQGFKQTEIVKELGISVMTLHRWREQRPVTLVVPSATPPIRQCTEAAALEDENGRLRSIVVNLLLEIQDTKVRMQIR